MLVLPTSTFRPAPEGLHHARCIDVVDLGIQQTLFGQKHLVELRWHLEIDGVGYLVSKRYTFSSYKQSALRKTLDMWRGKPLTEDEIESGFDLESWCLHRPAMLQIVHVTKADGSPFAKVQVILPGREKDAPPIPPTYIRVCQREPQPTHSEE